VLGSLYQVRAYNIKHSHDVKEFLEAYRLMLQRAKTKYGLESNGLKSIIRKGERADPINP
jgi:hypothetical protein